MGNSSSFEIDAGIGTLREICNQGRQRTKDHLPENDRYFKATVKRLTSTTEQEAFIYDNVDIFRDKYYYSPDPVPEFVNRVWKGAIDIGNEPFYCPLDWFKYPVKYDPKANDWPLAYHGSTEASVESIVDEGGFIPGKAQGESRVYLEDGERGVYVSPSIVYAAAYACPFQFKDKWIQSVLQVAVRNDIFEKRGGTLPGAWSHECFTYRSPSDKVTVDSNFEGNETLEWLIRLKADDKRTYLKSEDGVVVVGIMYKVSTVYPLDLPENEWMKGPLPIEIEDDEF